LFWSLGYQRASLPELERATGLRRGSLYALFADKRALFLEALDLYGQEALSTMDRFMPAGAGRADIVAWMVDHADRAHGRAGERGCFLVETVVEMGPHDSAIARRARKIFGAMLGRLERARAAAPDVAVADAGGCARTLLAGLEGLRVLGKSGQTKTEVDRSVASLVDVLIATRK
ncbi:MAG: TetR/AcrR family transcriptional regulator, partial [Solimonas sp.]